MPTSTKDPILLTPGPLTTSYQTKKAMLHDWGSRDASFIETNKALRRRLIQIVDGIGTHVCVPLQGSGTFAVEATLATLLSKDSESLVLINGSYGHRIVKILNYLNHKYEILETTEDTPPSIEELHTRLSNNKNLTHVLAVHCETTSGILNPIEKIGDVVSKLNKSLIIDAMSSFGAIPLSSKTTNFDAIIASSNKCLEGVPGIGFAVIKESILKTSQNNAHSLSLDLFDQWTQMEANQQWRFTPPTHVVYALSAALDQFDMEGGLIGRNRRYSENCDTLLSGMIKMGFVPFIEKKLQSPIIVTFKMPNNKNFNFSVFYETLKNKGYIIYPGKLTKEPSFRIGCIGDIKKAQINKVLKIIKETLRLMKVDLNS
mgnify:CR=1 FL=1